MKFFEDAFANRPPTALVAIEVPLVEPFPDHADCAFLVKLSCAVKFVAHPLCNGDFFWSHWLEVPSLYDREIRLPAGLRLAFPPFLNRLLELLRHVRVHQEQSPQLPRFL